MLTQHQFKIYHEEKNKAGIACSIIVLTKDNPEQLRDTLNSISEQHFQHRLEILIIESWSKPQRLQAQIQDWNTGANSLQIRVLRQWPPAGIYNAMNLALKVTNGETILFLNSGDLFYTRSAIAQLYTHWTDCSVAESSALPAVFGQAVICVTSLRLQWLTPMATSQTIRSWLRYAWPCHQAVLFESKWAKANQYSEECGFAADRQIVMSAIAASPENAYLATPVILYDLGGISSHPENPLKLIIKLATSPKSPKNQFRYLFKSIFYPIRHMYPVIMFIKAHLIALIAQVLKCRTAEK